MGPAEVLQLVGEPQRWQLLGLLAEGDRRVGDLVTETGVAQNLVSYHLRTLRDAGLVTARRSSADGRDTYYRVDLDGYGALVGAAASSLHPGVRLVPVEPEVRIPGRRRPSVLFLCTGNSARSQMAEALLEHRSEGTARATSAGSHPKAAIHPAAIEVLAAHGIDIAGRPTRHVDAVATRRFDRVVTLCDKVKEVCPELPGAPLAAHWSIADPAAVAEADGSPLPAFEAAYAEIDARIRLLVAHLAQPAQPAQPAHTEEHRHGR